jgi:choline kinase
MEITPANIHSSNLFRSRSSSRTRNSTANSRSTSSTRRPSIGKRSLSGTSLNKLTITPTTVDHEKSIPTTQAVLDNSLPLDFFKQDLITLIKALKVSKWHKRQLTMSNLVINRISGALTNSIYKLEYYDPHQNLKLPALLLRIYGKNVDSIIDRESELAILIKLSQKRIGPRLLGIFTNGRFEQFLEGFITLNKDQIRDEVLSQMLARRMKDLHYRIELDLDDRISSLPMSWKLINKWLDILQKDFLPNYEKNNLDTKEVFLVEFPRLKELIKKYRTWLFQKYDSESFSSNFKFCHNDTQYGNLLLNETFDATEIIVDTTPNTPAGSSASLAQDNQADIKSTSNKKDSNMVVIDFEYSGPNFPAYDLANHFSEWMSDYHHPTESYKIHEQNFPSKKQRLNMIKSYVEYDFQYPSSNLKTKLPPALSESNASELIEYEIKKLYNECTYWRSTVQIFWSLWGLIQSGPVKIASPNLSGKESSEPGIESTYTITTALDTFTLEEDAIIEEDITSTDDDFDYLKYAQQKVALILGDFIQFGLMDKSEIDEKYWPLLKIVDCSELDV